MLYTAIRILHWFQHNQLFLNPTRIDWDMTPLVTELFHICIYLTAASTRPVTRCHDDCCMITWGPAAVGPHVTSSHKKNFTYFYIPSEPKFHADFNGINRSSIWSELTELWGFLCSTVLFESIRQSRVTDPCVGTKFESCHGSWGRYVELIFHVTNHSNCLQIVEKWVEATKQIPHLVSPNYS